MTPLADVTASSSFVRLFALWCQCSEYQETSQYFGANVPRKSSSQGSPNSPFNLRQTFCCPFVGPSIHLADPIFAGEHRHLSSHVRLPIHRFCCWCLTFVRHQKKKFLCWIFPSTVVLVSACATDFAWYWPAFSTERAALFSMSFKLANRYFISTRWTWSRPLKSLW